VTSVSWGVSCAPRATAGGECISLAHGDGGKLTRTFIQEYIVPAFANERLATLCDSASLPPIAGPLAFTADSFVVSPLFFPGGDIGKLAVYGTANDLAVAGARPLWLSLSLIIEEGMTFESLRCIIDGIAAAARGVGATVVAGDTKVVPRGAADGLFISTAGIGELILPVPAGPAALEPGDEILVSGPIGRHGVAILAAREELGFVPPPQSDCAPLFAAVDALRKAEIPLRCLRDATRGGLAAVLHEWSAASGRTLSIDESLIPTTADVRGVCELLGLDPLNMANEGTMLIAIPAGWSDRAVGALHSIPQGQRAARIGEVRTRARVPVAVRRSLGVEQALEEPLGAPLPRIC
jgi:hydrogenase expression/formation protein HypE